MTAMRDMFSRGSQSVSSAAMLNHCQIEIVVCRIGT